MSIRSKTISMGVAGTVVALVTVAFAAEDWRKTGTIEEKVDNLVKIVPGTKHWMMEVGYRYQSIYWAAKDDQWEFANYQADGLEDTIDRVMIARTKRAASAQVFKDAVFPRIYDAIKTEDWPTFEAAFNDMASACMQCHSDNDYGFIAVSAEPSKPNNLILGMPIPFE